MATLDAAQRSLADPGKRAGGARRWLLVVATVMAATLAGIGITLAGVTRSWLRWVMVDVGLIAFWRSSATPPSAPSSRRISRTSTPGIGAWLIPSAGSRT